MAVVHPKEFEYGESVGSGAFGQIRKCFRDLEKTKSSDSDEAEQSLPEKASTMNVLDAALSATQRIAPKKQSIVT